MTDARRTVAAAVSGFVPAATVASPCCEHAGHRHGGRLHLRGPATQLAGTRLRPVPDPAALPRLRRDRGNAGRCENYASGWSDEKASVEAAVDEALSECNRFRDASSQPSCQLYAIGDLVVAGTDAAQLPRTKCAYVLSATTVPTAGPNAAACAELLSATLAPAPAVAGEPAANPSTATPLPAASALSAGQSTPSAPIPSPIASSPAVPEPDAEPTWPYRALVDVRVRQGPGNDYPIVGTLVRHAKVNVIGEWQGWLRIRLDDGQIGFVYGRWLVEAAE